MKKFIERFIESVLKFSGLVTSTVILLIVVFLFKEGSGLFRNQAIERGYKVVVSNTNTAHVSTALELKSIFDGEISNWKDLGGKNVEITPMRIDNIVELYSEEELGEDYERLPAKIAEYIVENEGVILFIPEQYVPQDNQCKTVEIGDLTPDDFFCGKIWLPTASPSPLFGTLPLLAGTLLVSLLAILLATPIGIAVAIYLAELSSPKMHKVLKPVIELLAGIPSIVYGFFGLVVIVPFVQNVFGLPVGETVLAGSIILAIMTLPTIITVGEDALRSTPRSLKEASLGLGANHWQTIYKVVLPYSASGLCAAVVLGIGRAVGETMAVLMVTGNAAVMPTSVVGPCRTIPATIAAELGETSVGSAHYQSLFMLGCILFVFTLLISTSVEIISSKKSKKL